MNFEKEDIKHISLTSIISDYMLIDKKIKTNKGWLYDNCPFCTHKNHFQIIIKDNSYNSFNGCCRGGDVINFAMEIENIDFKTAVNNLGERFNCPQSELILDTSKREREILKKISQHEEQRLKAEVNRFFDFLKFMDYEEIFQRAITLVGSPMLLHFIYNLKGEGIYE